MGLDYIWEDEDHHSLREVSDPTGQLSELLERACVEGLPFLSGVDRYGDTTFNRQQMPRLITELELLAKWSSTSAQRRLLERLIELCSECEAQVHTYIKIEGD